MPDRPALPRPLDRAVKVEAGHRCAIPTCRQHPIEIAHIEPRSGSNDVFDNLIALCANCHTRYDKGEIDRAAMRQYKANLSVVNSRYGDLEQRILGHFARNPDPQMVILLPGGMGILVENLIKDGLVELLPPQALGVISMTIMGVPSQEFVRITPSGLEFVTRWLQAQDLEAT